MTSGLLAFTGFEGEAAMRKQRTHFEQVPLEVVKKIVEKEVGAGRTITPSRLGKKKLEGMPVAVSTANW